MTASDHISGLVLCHAGGQRLAIPAQEVDAFEPAGEAARYAGAAFESDARAPADAKVLRHRELTLSVDRVEVFATPVPRLAVPSALSSSWGGALVCFVECAGELWPVVSLERLARGDGEAAR
ncbi:MAG: hypothetical protein JNM17_13660 [Archangium sp.]|nr:hypothetical protein [Archangium sp.]